MVLPVVEDLKGFLLIYIYDCAHPIALKNQKELKNDIHNFFFYPTCVQDEKKYPSINMFRLPDNPRNPFTGQVYGRLSNRFQLSSINLNLLKNFIDQSMSDFSRRILDMEDIKFYIEAKEEADINKVVLFTDKTSVTNTYKALSAEFKDKLRFYVVIIKDDGTNN